MMFRESTLVTVPNVAGRAAETLAEVGACAAGTRGCTVCLGEFSSQVQHSRCQSYHSRILESMDEVLRRHYQSYCCRSYTSA